MKFQGIDLATLRETGKTRYDSKRSRNDRGPTLKVVRRVVSGCRCCCCCCCCCQITNCASHLHIECIFACAHLPISPLKFPWPTVDVRKCRATANQKAHYARLLHYLVGFHVPLIDQQRTVWRRLAFASSKRFPWISNSISSHRREWRLFFPISNSCQVISLNVTYTSLHSHSTFIGSLKSWRYVKKNWWISHSAGFKSN